MKQLFYVGSYSLQGGYFPEANGDGLTTFSLNIGTGEIRKQKSYPEIPNATYLTKFNDNTLLVVSDKYYNPGDVLSFSIEENGFLNPLSSQSTFGTATCHVASNTMQNQVFAVSYLDSKLSVHSIKNGAMSPAAFVCNYLGSSINIERQEHSHVHQAVVSQNGKWLYVCDLGSDKIWLHDLSKLTVNFSDSIGLDVPSGYGPRHVTIHPKKSILYLICELNAHLITYEINESNGLLTLIDDVSTLPENYSDVPSAAAIKLHPTNNTLYVSNRTHDSITVFTIHKETGLLKFNARFSTEGNEPRDFNIDPSGKWLIVANQYSNSITSFELNEISGLPTGKIGATVKTGTPVCVLFK